MKERDIDKIFKDKLAEFETPVEPEVWGAIESSLNQRVPAGAKIHFLSRRIYYYAAAVAALLLLLLLPGRHEFEQPQIEEAMAVVDEVVAESDLIQSNMEKESEVEFEKEIVTGKVEKDVVPAEVEKEVKVEVKEVVDTEEKNEKKNGENAEEKGEPKAEDNIAEKAEKEAQEKAEEKRVETQRDVVHSDWREVVYADDMTVGKKKGKEYAFALASNFISSSSVSVSPQYLNYMSVGAFAGEGVHSIEQISQTQYSLPINVALQAQVKITDLLQVGVGVSYTNLRSKYEALINKKFYHVKQNLNYIGVPVNLYFTFIGKRYFTLYANVGGSIERGVAAVYRLSSYDVVEHRESAGMKGFQYSANLGFGMEYKFIPEIGLYLEPNIVYYFNSDMPASIRTDQPLQIKAEVGFRFHFNNK